MARTFEYVLHFVRCVTVTLSPNQIIIIIIIIISVSKLQEIVSNRFTTAHRGTSPDGSIWKQGFIIVLFQMEAKVQFLEGICTRTN